METKPELNNVVIEDNNSTEPLKKIKKTKPKKKIDFVVEEEDELAEITISFG